MASFVAAAKAGIQAALALLLLQGFGSPSQESFADPFARATTPPAQFLAFNADFSGMDAGDRNISTNYAPASWDSDYNVFDPDAGYIWDNGPVTNLSTYASSSGAEGPAARFVL